MEGGAAPLVVPSVDTVSRPRRPESWAACGAQWRRENELRRAKRRPLKVLALGDWIPLADYRFGYAVKMKSVAFANVWHVAPHLASCPTGGWLDKVAGANVPDAAL